MDNIRISTIKTTDKNYHRVFDLREEILRKPIGLSLKNEDLSGDALDTILIAENGDELLGCVMLHPTESKDKLKLRQMAVADNWQGKGIGCMLVGPQKAIAGKLVLIRSFFMPVLQPNRFIASSGISRKVMNLPRLVFLTSSWKNNCFEKMQNK